MVGRKPEMLTIATYGMTRSAQIGCSLFVPTSGFVAQIGWRTC